MSHDPVIHQAQTIILKALLFHPTATYSAMMKQTELSSDNFNFHLKALQQLGFIVKTEAGAYTLTAKGKEHANKIDTDSNTIERQPKVTVLLHIIRQSDRGLELLVQQRLKQPFYGFWGLPSGKIRWGETIIETAQRELLEETGLTCREPRLYGLHHKMDRNQATHAILEDKIFFEVLCLNPEGQLVESFDGGCNRFVTQSEIPTLGKLFAGVDRPIENRLHAEFQVEEKTYFYSSEEY